MLVFLILCGVGLALLPATPDARLTAPKDVLALQLEFHGWAAALGKKYASKAEFKRRFANFVESRREVARHNASGSRFRKGLNQFADLSDEEFMAKFRPKSRKRVSGAFRGFWERIVDTFVGFGEFLGVTSVAQPAIPIRGKYKAAKEVDWAKRNSVVDPPDQAECGGCYAFAVVSAIESAFKIKNGRLEKFSEQFLINCGPQSEVPNLHGCNGGLIGSAMEFFKKVGVHSAAEFPFTGKEGECREGAPPLFKINGYIQHFLNEAGLMDEIEKGPVAVSIEVTPDFRLYESGLMDFKYPCGVFLNHAVVAVGFSIDPATADPHTNYFKIRNSWGTDWGEAGYFRVELNGPAAVGFCGITEDGARPVL